MSVSKHRRSFLRVSGLNGHADWFGSSFGYRGIEATLLSSVAMQLYTQPTHSYCLPNCSVGIRARCRTLKVPDIPRARPPACLSATTRRSCLTTTTSSPTGRAYRPRLRHRRGSARRSSPRTPRHNCSVRWSPGCSRSSRPWRNPPPPSNARTHVPADDGVDHAGRP